MQNVAILARDTYQNVEELDRLGNETVLVGSEGADTAVAVATVIQIDGGALVASEGGDTGVAAVSYPNIGSGGGEIPAGDIDRVTATSTEGGDTGSAAVSAPTGIEATATEGEDLAFATASTLDAAAALVVAVGTEGADTAETTATLETIVTAVATEGDDTAETLVAQEYVEHVDATSTEGEDTGSATATTRDLGAFSTVLLSPAETQTTDTVTATVTVRDQFGTVVPDYPVVFSTGNELVATVPAPSVVTNGSGVAQVAIRPGLTGQVSIRAQIGSYVVSSELGVFDRLMVLGDSVTARVRVRDINARAKSGVLPVVSYSRPGVVSVSGLDATGSDGRDVFTINAVGTGETDMWMTTGRRASNRMRIKVR